IKVDCRRIPTRQGGEVAEEVAEEAQPEPVPDPVPEPEPVVAVVEAPEPEPAPPVPEPEPVAVEPEPVVVKRKVKRRPVETPVVEEFIPPPAPAITEIEYWWESHRSHTPAN